MKTKKISPISVISCFDGISAGQLALERAGIPVKSYYAFEIDKYAIKVTQSHYPNTMQLGDIEQTIVTGKPARSNAS